VVAPIAFKSPRARAGFRILAASIAPAPFPAPTSKWISSINKIISPADCCTSRITFLRRSSNSPCLLAPAISEPISSEYTWFPARFSGTSPFTIRWARPSTIAVLPTPASPIIMGLFFRLREIICKILRISSVRPIIGSISPFSICWFRFLPNWSSADKSPVFLSIFLVFRNCEMASSSLLRVIPFCLRSLDTWSPDSNIPLKICSIDIYSSWILVASFLAVFNDFWTLLETLILVSLCNWG